jgi:hypothetical protein
LKATEQKPMYLPDVEANPQQSPYADLIQVAKAAGREYWQIWHLCVKRRLPHRNVTNNALGQGSDLVSLF